MVIWRSKKRYRWHEKHYKRYGWHEKRYKRYDKTYLAGRLTVEAAYISSLLLFVIISVIYMGFHLHNLAVSQSMCAYLGNLSAKTALKWIDPEAKTLNVSEEVRHVLNEPWKDNLDAFAGKMTANGRADLKERLLAAGVDTLDISYSYSTLLKAVTCTVNIGGRTRFPIVLFDWNGLAFDSSCTVTSVDAVRAVWLMDSVKGAVSQND